MAKGKPSYYLMFQSLGAWLDDTGPTRFTLLETVDGFTVILTLDAPGRPRLSEAHFKADALTERKRRSILESLDTGRKPDRWPLAAAGRRVFLSSLGYELDYHGAHAVMIDELDDQLVLTYSYRDEVDREFWHKHIVYLGPREISAIIEAAGKRTRDVQQPKRVFRW